ncbi:hypothetical protein [uncultured Massilia sp.]|uniref:hypothetical protein n=1 Tax=uncultured Massilia sp. TaxID=169973 RepID=UPI0025D6BFDF|nr:hypothetical protein [uncultured Massilia sp.]
MVRAIALPFRPVAGADMGHWERLCALANALQDELGLPAPAVSVASAGGYVLWLSLEQPVAAAEARRFVDLLALAHPALALPVDAIGAPVALPPCLDPATGKWAAFIHPGMGASFADESGLDMAPPAAGQVGFLEGLQSIDAAQWHAAFDRLQPAAPTQAPSPPPAPAAAPAPSPRPSPRLPGALPEDLLLKDATLEDIVRFLHARNIEPTFRHLLPPA